MENEIEVIEINPGDLILFKLDEDTNPFRRNEITLGVVQTGYDSGDLLGKHGYAFTFEGLRFLGKDGYQPYSGRSSHILKNFGPLAENAGMLRYLADDITKWGNELAIDGDLSLALRSPSLCNWCNGN